MRRISEFYLAARREVQARVESVRPVSVLVIRAESVCQHLLLALNIYKTEVQH